MTEPSIDELAARGRDALAHQAGFVPTDEQRAAKRAAARDSRVATALEPTSGLQIVAVIAGLVGALIVTVIAVPAGRLKLVLVLGVAAVGPLAGWLYLRRLVRAGREAQRRWLDQLPFAFDRERYFDLLAECYEWGILHVEVTFARPINAAREGLLCDAVVGALGTEASARFEADKLRITSPRLPTYFRGNDSSTPKRLRYHNEHLHRWLRRCVETAVLPIHDGEPVAALEVTTAVAPEREFSLAPP